MSLTLLHGEHHVQSRNELVALISQLKQNNYSITHLEAKVLEVPQLETLLGTQSLFGDQQAIVIEELFSLPQSQKRKQLIELIATAQSDATPLILWEKKKLTPSQLKSFKNATVKEFKISSAVFVWLDQFHTKSLKQRITLLRSAIAQDGPELCLAMLTRQIRLLLTAKSGGVVAGPAFVVQKTHKQANNFTEQELVQYHEKLTFFDYHWKTGQQRLGMQQALEQLMLQ